MIAPDNGPPLRLRVSSDSRPSEVADTICTEVGLHGVVMMEAMGAAAVNQAVKGLAVADGRLRPGRRLDISVWFRDVTSKDGTPLTGVGFRALPVVRET